MLGKRKAVAYDLSGWKKRKSGTYYKPKKYSWRKKWMKGKTGFAAKVKSVILKTAEKKWRSVNLSDAWRFNGASGSTANTPDLFGQYPVGHNFPFMFHLVNNASADPTKHPIPTIGTTDQNRNGDEIYATGFRLRIQCENDANRHNNTWKFWLIQWNTVQGDPCVPANLFQVATGNNLIETIQADRYTVKYLGKYRTGARDVAVDAKTDVFIDKWIPYKRKLCFRQDTGTSSDNIVISKGMKEMFTIVGVCYDASNTIGDTNIGNCRINGTFYYKDP